MNRFAMVPVLLAIGSAALAQPKPTPETARLAAAGALQNAMGGDALVGRTLDAMRGSIITIIQQAGHVDAATATSACDDLIVPAMKAHLAELRASMTLVWAENFSVDELAGLRAFYLTPLGRKLIERQPMLAQATTKAGIAWGQQVLRDTIEQKRDQLKQRGILL